MEYKDIYNEWLSSSYIDDKTKDELLSIKDNEEEIKERFYKNLEFGTGGIRGILGAGTSRMNVYVVMKATQALADIILNEGSEFAKRGVAVAFDCRHNSDIFAKCVSEVFAGNGIPVFTYETLRPTPQLSYTVISKGCAAGVMITASHNPKEYNGYKVYWDEGAQILSDIADKISSRIEEINDFNLIKRMDFNKAKDKNLINILGEEIDTEYIDKIKTLSLLPKETPKDIKIIYTPLNGTGNIPVRKILKEQGFNSVFVVPEQEKPDPDFTTVKYPNPEDARAFEYAKKYGYEHNADLLLATDPDADRLAVMAKNKNGEYVSLNGNQTGALLVKYVLEQKKQNGTLKKKSAVVKTIVTGNLGKNVAKSYGVETFECLTGFKNIYSVVDRLLDEGIYEFILGYEESIGYNAGVFVRDKDAVCSAMLLCEAAVWCKQKDMSLYDALNELFLKFGYYAEKQVSAVLKGIEGKEKINAAMEKWRMSYPAQIAGLKLIEFADYKSGIITDEKNEKTCIKDIPKSNVLKFNFEQDCWYAIRPSGTEPKIKIYLSAKADSSDKAEKLLLEFEETIKDILKKMGID